MSELLSVATASVLAITVVGFAVLALVTHFLAHLFSILLNDDRPAGASSGKPVNRS